MKIDWNAVGCLEARCPGCGDCAPKPVKLSVPSALAPALDLPLAVCQSCGVAFFPTLEAVAYEGLNGADAALDFYLEQGAGIDAMIEPVEAVASDKVQRYLEIGCGYGLSLDYARTMFGWSVKGVDPGFGARAGKPQLGLDIIEGYLRSPEDVGRSSYDLVLCSEVLEHVFDPEGFLRVVQQTLTPDGILVLTTPNAALIAKDTPAGTLIPLLSPGYHVTLYSDVGLESLLQRVGFKAVAVTEHGPTLRAAASMGPLAVNLKRPLERARYLDYLERSAGKAPPDSPLALGLLYRYFKELVHAGRYDRAEEVSSQVLGLCRRRWVRDLALPEIFHFEDEAPADLSAYHKLYPFCACGILYFRAMLAWRRDKNAEAARFGFLSAARVGEQLRAVLLKIGADDGETEELAWRAIGCAAYALAATDPETAASEAASFGSKRSPILLEAMPAALAAEMRRAIFVTLVNLGQGAAAEGLANAVAAEMPDDPDQSASAAFALGIFALNHLNAPGQAYQWFSRAHAFNEKAMSAPLGDGEPVELAWRALGHAAIAIASSDPESAATQAWNFGREPDPSFGKTMPAPLAAEMRRAVFMTLVNLGCGNDAARLADAVVSEISDNPDESAPVCFALGIHNLNHSGNPKRAVDWFAKAHSASGQVAKRDPAAAEALLWSALYHEALALVRAGERRAAENRLRYLIGPKRSDLPEVSPDLRQRAIELAHDFNLSV